MDRAPQRAQAPKEAPLTDKEQVLGALEHLEGEGRAAFDAIYELGIDQDEFLHRVRTFNNLEPEARGAGRYDSGLSLDERKNRSFDVQMPMGRKITVMLQTNGEVILSAVAAQ